MFTCGWPCLQIAITLWDNYKLDPDKAFLAMAFPKLEKYVEWDMQWGQVPPGNGTLASKYLLHWGDAGDAGAFARKCTVRSAQVVRVPAAGIVNTQPNQNNTDRQYH